MLVSGTMTPVHQFELLLLLIAAVIGLGLLARRLCMPPAAAFVLGGIGIALVPGAPDIELDPELALVLFLPPILMSGAYFTDWRDFKADLRIILQLAVGAVVFTTLSVGVVAHWVAPWLPWGACFALGAIVSPPDAVSAKAVLQGLRLPPRMVVLLEGESLVNDATGLVLFRMAVAATLTGTFSIWQAAGQFAMLAAGGVVTGLLIGLAAAWVAPRLRDSNQSIVFGLLIAWGSYIVGEMLGVSGVLSTVACGLVVGWKQHKVLSAAVRTQAGAVWNVLVFLLESLVFILIGLALRGTLARLGDRPEALAWPVLGVIAAVIGARFVWMVAAIYLPRLLWWPLRKRDPYPVFGVPVVMSWAGMRGVVSLAAALALPQDFPGRDFIQATTFAVILVTVLVQGATLGPLIRWLRLDTFSPRGPADGRLSMNAARARVAAAQLAAVEARSAGQDGAVLHPRLLEQYGWRARASARFIEDERSLVGQKDEHFAVVLAAVSAGRAELMRLRRAGSIADSVLHRLEKELDLEEIIAGGHVSAGV